MLNAYLGKIMDYKKYSEELEKIIEAITMPEHTRITVDAFVKQAREKAEDWAAPVEHKFKVGDWVVTDYGKVSQVVSVDNAGDGYTLDDGVYFSGSWCDMYHLWTIADAKDGDVLSMDFNGIQKIVIFKSLSDKGVEGYGITAFKDSVYFPTSYGKEYYSKTWTKTLTPATKEQRSRLFTELEKAGYKWDVDKKELHKIQQHYDIANFKPFDKVLVRDRDIYKWKADYFSHYAAECMFSCVGSLYKQCIPFEGNEHLLGTNGMCDEQYINW